MQFLYDLQVVLRVVIFILLIQGNFQVVGGFVDCGLLVVVVLVLLFVGGRVRLGGLKGLI